MLKINKSDQLPSLLLFWVLFIAAMALGLLQLSTPKALSSDASPHLFSAARAYTHVEKIAEKPHMVGSVEHARVYAYLLAQLKAMDLEVQEQAATVVYAHPTRTHVTERFAKVKNIIAKLPGTHPDLPAIALMSHYDSVPTAAGAGDAASGVATLLETVRALMVGERLKRSVILVITDAEEVGLMGAQAFYREHAWANDIGLILNFEARGTSGNTQMFETSDGNAWLISEFAKAVEKPAATSISYEVYKRMPNDTDVSIVKPYGYQVLNFGFVDNAFDYHSPGDVPENLNQGSLQHSGVQALSLTRHFANLDVWATSTDDNTYFNITVNQLVHYSTLSAMVFGYLVLLFACITIVMGLRAKYISLQGIMLTLIAIVLFIVAYLFFGKYLFINLQNDLIRPKNLNYQYHKLFVAAVFLSIGLCALVYQFLNRWLKSRDMIAAAWILWALISAVTLFKVPNASYAFIWPLLFILIGQHIVWRKQNRFWAIALAGLFTWYIWTLLVYMTTLALGLDAPSLMAPFFIVVLSQMMMGLLMLGKRTYTVLIVCSLGALIYVGLVPNYSDRYPRPTEVFYWHDADTNHNYWATHGENKDAWAQQFFPKQEQVMQLSMPRGRDRVLVNPAEKFPVNKAQLNLLSKITTDDITKLSIQIQPTDVTEMGSLIINDSGQFISATIDSKPLALLSNRSQTETSRLKINYFGLGVETAILEVEIKNSAQFILQMTEVQSRWPADMPVKPRPKDIDVSNWEFSDSTVITQSVQF